MWMGCGWVGVCMCVCVCGNGVMCIPQPLCMLHTQHTVHTHNRDSFILHLELLDTLRNSM